MAVVCINIISSIFILIYWNHNTALLVYTSSVFRKLPNFGDYFERKLNYILPATENFTFFLLCDCNR